MPILTAARIAVTGRLDGPVDLTIEGGDRLIVTGENGIGKSTLLDVLAGVTRPTNGRVDRHPSARIALLPQEVPDWPAELTGYEMHRRHVQALVSSGRLDRHAPGVSLSGTGLLDARTVRTPVGRMSQGQQRRLQLALLFAEQPDLLLLDEPTNHLSAALVDELTAVVQQTASAVVIATHDRQLLEDLASWPRLRL